MKSEEQKYCLDANVLIEAWQKYYSPKFFPGYWDMLNELGSQDRIFLPQAVADEITKTDDDLSQWLSTSKIPVQSISESITLALRSIYAAMIFSLLKSLIFVFFVKQGKRRDGLRIIWMSRVISLTKIMEVIGYCEVRESFYCHSRIRSRGVQVFTPKP